MSGAGDGEALERLRQRAHAALALVTTAAAVAHGAVLVPWYVEDAAISFAYAENLAAGEGLVAQPGGDRLEGYSNPTWVALLALLRLAGMPLYDGVHGVQLALTAAAMIATWAAARELFGRRSDLQVVPLLFLAANAQFAVWGQAGLENGLWSLLLALGIWRVAVETRGDGPRAPLSAAPFLLLALTRPEGAAYAAVAGAWHLAAHGGRLGPGVAWAALAGAPYLAYQAAHLAYFAWPFANTYYAKRALPDAGSVLDWTTRWRWIRSFFLEMGQGFFLPVWLAGVAGHAGGRGLAVAAGTAGVAVAVELAGDQRHLLPAALGGGWLLAAAAARGGPPRRALLGGGLLGAGAVFGLAEAVRAGLGWAPGAVPAPGFAAAAPALLAALGAAGVALPAGLPRASARAACWAWCWLAVGFAVYADGDWMTGYRWLALVTVPASLLFAWGVDHLARLVDDAFAVPGRGEPLWTVPALGVVGALVALQLPANVRMTWLAKVGDPDVAPTGIRPRIRHVEAALRRVGHDEPPVVLDVDMGAHLLWTDWRMLDVAGLVDLPFAHHRYAPTFLRRYVFEEQRPEVVHLHDFWATRSGIPAMPEFARDYVEIPGFPAGVDELHVGNHLRRDLLVRPEPPEGAAVRFGEGLWLAPPRVRATPATDRSVAVDVGVWSDRDGADRVDFRLLLFAARDGAVAKSWDVPPGFDWLWPRDWRPGEAFVGPVALPTTGLPPGRYDLGCVLLRADGAPIPALPEALPPAARLPGPERPPVFATTEVTFPDALEVVTLEARAARAAEAREAALAAAGAGDCAGAEAAWRRARDHRPLDRAFVETFEPRVAPALGACWARASDAGEAADRVSALRRAQRWDRAGAEVAGRAAALAEEREAAGLAARDAGDLEAAYRALSDAADLDGTRVWARRRAEEARAALLGLPPP